MRRRGAAAAVLRVQRVTQLRAHLARDILEHVMQRAHAAQAERGDGPLQQQGAAALRAAAHRPVHGPRGRRRRRGPGGLAPTP